jgi:hypothetical protein
MKLLAALISALVLSTGSGSRAAEPPRGELLELHSCQLYIGGCIASSEVTQEGNCLLRVWRFTGGSHGGVNLAGLQIALLEIGNQNLAIHNTRPTRSVVYLPNTATGAQSAALVAWLRSQLPRENLVGSPTRTVSMSFHTSAAGATFAAGDTIQVDVVPVDACGLVSCGESLWYTPRSVVTTYTVGVTRKSVVREPLLSLKWIDHGKNDVFLARFGEGATAHAGFTAPALACATTDHNLHE